MKKILLLIFILVCFVGCRKVSHDFSYDNKPDPKVVVYHVAGLNKTNIRVVKIDDCEYLVAEKNSYRGGVSIIHKANCANSEHYGQSR